MSLQEPIRISEDDWLRRLGSPQARVNVTFGPAPGRLYPPPEWYTGPRRMNEHLVYFIARETVQAEVAGDSFLCSRGSCCWVTAATDCRFFSNKSPLIWRFRFSLLPRRNARPLGPDQDYYFLPNSPAIAETVNSLLAELTQQFRWKPESIRSRLIQLSILFFRNTKPLGKRRALTAQQQNAISRLLENTRPDRWLRPHDLAKAAGLSPDYFSRVFHYTHDVSPRQWLLRQRLSYAVVLLQETPLRVGEIAERLGYANIHLFSRQFSACFGRSPTHFRQ